MHFFSPSPSTSHCCKFIAAYNFPLAKIFQLELHKIYSSWKLRWKYKFGLKESHLYLAPSAKKKVFAHFISKPQNYWLKLFDKSHPCVYVWEKVQYGERKKKNFIFFFFAQNLFAMLMLASAEKMVKRERMKREILNLWMGMRSKEGLWWGDE